MIKNCKSFGKKLLIGILLATSLVIGCAEDNPQQHVVVDEPVEIDPSHVGMIMGQVFSSKIENNQVVYEPYKWSYGDLSLGAYVWIVEEEPTLNPEFGTATTSDGVYSIDYIPAGTYTIEALRNSGDRYYSEVPKDSKSVTVIKQETVTVPDLKLIVHPVLKGKIEDGGTPFADKEIDLYGGMSSAFVKLHSTTTSSDGSYAFERSKQDEVGIMEKFSLKSSEAIIMFMDTDTEEIFISHHYDIREKDAYVSEYK